MTERTLLDALEAARYPRDSWAFMRHVNEGTGARSGRILDALAMSLWPSRGLHLHGIEVKCHRSDWLRELDQPDKADGWFSACHLFWLAAAEGVAKVEELPPAWGLVEVGQKVRVLREPTVRKVPQLAWQRLAALLRAAVRAGAAVVPADDVKAEAQRLADTMVNSALELERRKYREQLARETELRQAVQRFQQAAGISIESCLPEHAKIAGEVIRGERAASDVRGRLEYLQREITAALGRFSHG